MRAAIMGTVSGSLALQRPRNVLPGLPLAAMAMVAVDPNVFWRVSFQLSFAAMAGITVLSSPIRESLLDEDHFSSRFAFRVFVAGTTSMTVAATLASLLTLPAMPFVLISNALAGFGGLLSPAIGVPLAWVFSSYVTGVVSLLARIPAASVHIVGVGILFMLVWYTSLTLAYISRKSPFFIAVREHFPNLPNLRLPLQLPGSRLHLSRLSLIALPLLGMAAMLWLAALSEPDPRLHVYFVDVRQGDGIFIVTPSGQQILIDGGPDPQAIAQFLGQHMPPEDRTIDIALLTHAHSDRATGLVEALRRYDIQTVMQRTLDYDSPVYSEWLRAVDQENAEVIEAQAGQAITFDDGVVLQILSPPQQLPVGTTSDVDNASIALRLTYGERSFLLAGDMFMEAERCLLSTDLPLDSDVLKVDHHGSRNASTAEFLAEVRPAIAVISARANNRYGHPTLEVLSRLATEMTPDMIYVTGESGTIDLTTDGKTVELIDEK